MNETFKEKLKKLLSTKFIGMVGSIAAGVLLITQDKYIEGAALIVIALITYCVANSYITVKTSKAVITDMADLVSTISLITDNKIDDIVAQVLQKVAEKINETDNSRIPDDGADGE